MLKNIWKQCNGSAHLISFGTNAWRLVEEQDIVATRKLVDSLEEQNILEELIELNKPPLTPNLIGLHRLLYTPFRYPPLKHGSRFGSRFELALWYGSLELNTAMAETAYYRFNFLRASKADFGNVVTNHSAFSAQIKTNRGIDLTQSPFSEFTQAISSPISYQESQRLGTAMRQEKVESFYYLSARDQNKGRNIALFTPKAFFKKNPNSNSFQSWKCIVNQKVAEFVRSGAINIEERIFPIEIFMISHELPFPAN